MTTSSVLPDPKEHPNGEVVIYDGKCGFCRKQVERLHKFDRQGNFSYLSLHDPRVAVLYPDLSYEQLMEQMWLIDRHGKRHGGVEAIKVASRRLRLLWPLAVLLHIPFTAKLWRRAYMMVARRRYLISGNPQCEEGTCKVHLQ